jgi:hypothetical protein
MLAYVLVAAFCERVIEPSGSVVRGELLYRRGDCHHQNKGPALWSCNESSVLCAEI